VADDDAVNGGGEVAVAANVGKVRELAVVLKALRDVSAGAAMRTGCMPQSSMTLRPPIERRMQLLPTSWPAPKGTTVMSMQLWNFAVK
jgi:hypothetical protein